MSSSDLAQDNSELVQELTATMFVFRREAASGRLQSGFVWHARFGGLLPPCGHWEEGETLAGCAIRETLEEGGWRTELLAPPSLPLPDGFPHPAGDAPWWVVDMRASPDNHTPARHLHQDHVFVGRWLEDVQEPETKVMWLSEAEVAETPDLPEDSRLQAKVLFGQVEHLIPA